MLPLGWVAHVFGRCLLLAAAIAAVPVAAEDAAATGDRLARFEREVRPLLIEHCYACHAADADRIEGGLQVDSLAALLAGGDSGPAIVPGNADGSLLVEAIHYDGYEMPPSGPLASEDVAVLVRWIDDGAFWPEEDGPAVVREVFDLEERRARHWAWAPVADPHTPEVQDDAWPRDNLDRFVLARLEAAGLSPSAEADRLVWLRRVSLALVGLPPSPSLQQRFLADASPAAAERVVDELLASPHFGETWARHWLDVVRFAESYGHEFDHTLPHAAAYRAWAVRAFNDDLPFDQFAREQIAGDLLPPRVGGTGLDESIIATGFWQLGEAMRAPVDVAEDEADRIDNQIDAYSKAFLGLTVSCARCHDHKFDAIATRDYYALFGVLRSSRRVEQPLDVGGRLAAGTERIDELLQTAREQSGVAPAEAFPELSDGSVPPPHEWTADSPAFVASTAGRPALDWERGRVVPPGVVSSAVRAGRLQGSLRSPPFELTGSQVHVLVRASGGRVRLVVGGYFLHDTGSQLQFAGTLRDKLDTRGRWQWITLKGDVGKFRGQRVWLEVSDRGGEWVEVAAVRQSNGGPLPAPNVAETAVTVPPEVLRSLRETAATLPPPLPVLATADASGADSPVYIRGAAAAPGAMVPRGMLAACGPCSPEDIGPGSGRLAVALRTTSSENPLFARVAVNRIWHHLFGRGLVPSCDDFGEMGQRPSHPDLLDALARDFIADGYSTKRLVRRLVLSATFRQASRPATPDEVLRDPANTLLARFPLRRLTAEAIRDSLLAVSGRLNATPPERSVPVHLTTGMTGRGKPAKSGPADGDRRRSVYLEVRRNFLNPSLLAFDAPAPAAAVGRRSVSNVPAQSLTLLNDPFVAEQAAATAEVILSGAATSASRLQLLWHRALARDIRPDEADRLTRYLAAAEEAGVDESAAWAEIVHAVFNFKEFVFVP